MRTNKTSHGNRTERGFFFCTIAIYKMWVYNKDEISQKNIWKGKKYEKTEFFVGNRSVAVLLLYDGLQ